MMQLIDAGRKRQKAEYTHQEDFNNENTRWGQNHRDSLRIVTYDYYRYSTAYADRFPTTGQCEDPGIEIRILYSLLHSLGYRNVTIRRVANLKEVVQALQHGTADFAGMTELLTDIFAEAGPSTVTVAPSPSDRDENCLAYLPKSESVVTHQVEQERGLPHLSTTFVICSVFVYLLCVKLIPTVFHYYHFRKQKAIVEVVIPNNSQGRLCWNGLLTVLLGLYGNLIRIESQQPVLQVTGIIRNLNDFADRLVTNRSTLVIADSPANIRAARQTARSRTFDTDYERMVYPMFSGSFRTGSKARTFDKDYQHHEDHSHQSFQSQPWVARKLRAAYDSGNVPLSRSSKRDMLRLVMDHPEQMIVYDYASDWEFLRRQTGCPLEIVCLPNSAPGFYHWFWRRGFRDDEFLRGNLGVYGADAMKGFGRLLDKSWKDLNKFPHCRGGSSKQNMSGESQSKSHGPLTVSRPGLHLHYFTRMFRQCTVSIGVSIGLLTFELLGNFLGHVLFPTTTPDKNVFGSRNDRQVALVGSVHAEITPSICLNVEEDSSSLCAVPKTEALSTEPQRRPAATVSILLLAIVDLHILNVIYKF